MNDGQDLGEALDTLLHQMARARKAFDRHERSGAMLALFAVGGFVDYLEKQRASSGGQHTQDLSGPLLHLMAALNDLDRGVSAPMLLPASPGTKGTPPFAILQGRATAAAAMDLYMSAGMSEIEASRHVARRIKNTTIAASARGRPDRLPKYWRDEVRKLFVSESFAELPADAPEPKRAAGTYNEIVRTVTAEAERLGYSHAQIIQCVDRLLAVSHILRPAVKSEMPPGYPTEP